MAAIDSPIPSGRTGWSSLKDLNGYQWFVFIVCCLAWDMDCLDQQLFVLARPAAMRELIPNVQDDDPRIQDFARSMAAKAAESGKSAPTLPEVKAAMKAAAVRDASANATAIFLLGWGLGGIGFGIMGDRYGRVKTLMLTILLYAIFTGFSALSTSTWDFYAYRLLTGLGVGGVFAASVTLLAETMPNNARPYILGLFQASSVLGNCTAALTGRYLSELEFTGAFEGQTFLGNTLSPWRIMFLIGILPAFLVVLIQFKLKEPEKWLLARAAGIKSKGLYAGLFDEKRTSRNAIFGLLLALSGVIGLWGIGFFSPDLQRYVSEPQYKQEAIEKGFATEEQVKNNELPPAAQKYVNHQLGIWQSNTSLLLNGGSFFGIFAFSFVTGIIGRKLTFAIFLVFAGLMTAFVFLNLETRSDIFWMIPLMGFFQLALFGGYAIYFPELFPTRLRSTGTSFCYNVGRLIAVGGTFVMGTLSSVVFAHYPAPEPLRYAGLCMCLVFLLGLIALPFLPETKGKPLPE